MIRQTENASEQLSCRNASLNWCRQWYFPTAIQTPQSLTPPHGLLLQSDNSYQVHAILMNMGSKDYVAKVISKKNKLKPESSAKC